jgi:hypothetical protein
MTCPHEKTEHLGWQDDFMAGVSIELVNCLDCGSTLDGGGRKPIPEAEMQRNLVMERMLEIVKHKGESHESRNQK